MPSENRFRTGRGRYPGLTSDRSRPTTKVWFVVPQGDDLEQKLRDLCADYCGLLQTDVALSVVLCRAIEVLHRRVSRASSEDDRRREVELLVDHSCLGRRAAAAKAERAFAKQLREGYRQAGISFDDLYERGQSAAEAGAK